MKLKLVDAFTHEPYAGNPAGVVWQEAGLSKEEMQKIAREVNHSETVFLVGREGDGADSIFVTRFFTPAVELRIAGHPTIALFHALAEEGVISLAGDTGSVVRQQTKAGLLPVEVRRGGAAGAGRASFTVFMTQKAPVYEDRGRSPADLAEALGAGQDVIGFAGLRPEIVSTGLRHLIVPVKPGLDLGSVDPDDKQLAALNQEAGVETTHLFRPEETGRFDRVLTRDFAPAVGISEDPATGSANGALGAYLAKRGLLGPGSPVRMTAFQGASLGRPSTIEVEITMSAAEVTGVKVGGAAVTVFEGEILV